MKQKAGTVWKSLNGLICTYKPAESSCEYVKNKILSNLCYELNNLEIRPPQNYIDIVSTTDDISVKVRPSYADNVLCVGPRYQPTDFEVFFPSPIGKRTSGILVLGINKGDRTARAIRKYFLPKCFFVKGILGQATRNFHFTEKVIARATYDRIEKKIIDQVLSSYQAAYQKKILQDKFLTLKSEATYDAIVSGLHRATEKKAPIIYSLKCIEFQPPNFTLEVNCINENEETLLELIHNLGLSLKCYATCTGLQCIRHGCFTLDHALLKKHWKLEYILKNMKLCSDTLQKHFSKMTEFKPIIKTSEIQG